MAQTTALAHSLTTAQSARLFALLNLTFADSVIAFYDAKYTYDFWRPVTTIREAANDSNPATLRNPNCELSDMAEEASLRRIFAGVHFRSDFASGRRVRRAVADCVRDNLLTRIHEGDDPDDR